MNDVQHDTVVVRMTAMHKLPLYTQEILLIHK